MDNQSKYTPGPWTVKEQLYYDNETGKPIGTDYWVLGKNGEELACCDSQEDAQLIALSPQFRQILSAMVENCFTEVESRLSLVVVGNGKIDDVLLARLKRIETAFNEARAVLKLT